MKNSLSAVLKRVNLLFICSIGMPLVTLIKKLQPAIFTPIGLLLLTALFLTVSANITFFNQVTDVYPLNDNIGFLVSLTILLFAFLALLLQLFNLLLPVKIVSTSFILIAVFSGYFADQFGTVIDIEMIRNTLQTNVSEASDLFSMGLVWRVILLGVIPIVAIVYFPTGNQESHPSWFSRFKMGSLAMLVTLVVIVICIVSSSAQYASFFREHKPLRYYTNPIYPIYSAINYVSKSFISKREHSFIEVATFAEVRQQPGHKELIIMIVGETARIDHFSLNGYARQTNPMLQQLGNVISYTNISSCGTSTAISVPCMFSNFGQQDFDVDESYYTENVLDIIQKSGVSVLWRDNNSDSKGVALRVPFEDFRTSKTNPECDDECRDTGMLSGLQEYIEKQPGDILIVLHQMGSHGPAYYKRYPKEFERFTPVCASAELASCTQQEIVNAYDNTILYTDYFLSKVIELLTANEDKYEASMIYVSDHGESLGESGAYLHGLPYMFAPDAQTQVPVIVWAGARSDIDYLETVKLKDVKSSHDAVASTLLALFEISSDASALKTPPLVVMQPE